MKTEARLAPALRNFPCPECGDPVYEHWHFCPRCGNGIFPIACRCTEALQSNGTWSAATPACVERTSVGAITFGIRILCPACHRATKWCQRTWHAVTAWNLFQTGRGHEGDVTTQAIDIPPPGVRASVA